MIKGAIIGLGKMGLSHAAIVGAHPDVDMVAVCDTSSLVLDTFNKFSKVKTYNDYKEMIIKESLDFVLIATPTPLHYSIVKFALEKGLHVFCEKPFSLTTREGEELLKIAQSRFLINQLGFHNHFIGTFREKYLEIESRRRRWMSGRLCFTCTKSDTGNHWSPGKSCWFSIEKNLLQGG
jgi:predicted dehydrogenase